MDKRIYETGIEATYKRSVLWVISTVLAVFIDAAVVIAGIKLLKLVVDVERRKHDTRRAIDLMNTVHLVDNALEKYQQDWAYFNRGR